MNAALAAVGAVSLLAAVAVVARVKREYEGPGVLSDLTVVAVWALYTAIVVVVLVASAVGAWPIGLASALSVPLGVVLVAAGLALVVAGLASMASFRRMSGMQPDTLITGGAFRISRNPQNVGIATAMSGAAILGDSWLALLASGGFWLIFYVYVRFEEEHLARAFGEPYDRYRRRTPRFLGLPRRGVPTP